MPDNQQISNSISNDDTDVDSGSSPAHSMENHPQIITKVIKKNNTVIDGTHQYITLVITS
jgi:hypothetical protein